MASARRPVAGTIIAGAVVLVLIAVVVIVVAWRNSGVVAGPGAPPTRSYPAEPVRVSGQGMLNQKGDGPLQLCVGPIGASHPATCGRTVEFTGLTWQQVPWADRIGDVTQTMVTVTGTWRDGVLAVDSVTKPVLPSPGPPTPDLSGLCDNPSGDRDADPYELDGAAFEALPGYQALWVTYPKDGPNAGRTVYHLAVTHDTAGATVAVRRSFRGLLCVGTIPGPPLKALMSASEKLTRDADAAGQRPLILTVSAGLADGRNGLVVTTVAATAQEVARVNELVGSDVAPWVTVVGEFRIID